MSEEEPFFVARNGAVWACWLSGRPAVKLGAEAEVRAAMKQFVADAVAGDPSEAVPREASPPTPPAAPPPRAPPPPAPPVTPRTEKERIEKRHELTILGRVFTGSGPRNVTVLDLSEQGCRFHDPSGHYSHGTALTIKLGPIGPVAATVKWRREDYVGIQFANPLYPSVMEHIRQHFDVRRTNP